MPAPQPSASPAPATELLVEGMTCQNCARKVRAAIQGVPGVASATVSPEAGRAKIRWQTAIPPAEAAVLEAVRQAGYGARIAPTASDATAKPVSFWAGWGLNVVLGGAVTSVLLLGEWVGHLAMTTWFLWVSFVLALAVQAVCGARFYRGAWNQLQVGASNMDTLVALGSTTAFGFSAWGLFTGYPGHLFFMEGAAIITLISVGHWLEAQASAKAASALHALLNLTPPTARRLNKNMTEIEVPVAELQIGDSVVLRPGDRVPTDGTVGFGQSAVDEAMLTGESLPVEKQRGDKLYAGTVNQNSRLVMRVTATGEATALAGIIAVVERAQSSRANIQRLGDRVSSVFVPIVVLVAVATGLWWGLSYDTARAASDWAGRFLWPAMVPATALAAAVIQAVAVLIVACPCAMGLATPAAIMAGANAAARRGILVRDGEALEKSGTITAVLFDKTGTLTTGKIECAATLDLRPENERSLSFEKLAANLAQPSSHPLSQAIGARNSSSAPGGVPFVQNPSLSPPVSPIAHPTRADVDVRAPFGGGIGARNSSSAPGGVPFVQNPSLSPPVSPIANPTGADVDVRAPMDGWQELRGQGIEARWSAEPALGTATLRLGSLRWLEESRVDLTPATGFIEEWTTQGATVVGVSADRRLLGVIALRDALKPLAAEVIQQLRQDGKAIFLITGDTRRTAAAIAQAAGITADNVFAEVRPEKKAEIIKELQGKGRRIAFVGDGINDAPALEQADLGIAVSRASDVAREAADIILLNSDLQAIPEALALAQATLRTIKQNLFWAFFYNAAAIPLAALGFLSPVLCAATMGLSDLVVIGNALRLQRWKN